MSAPQLIKRPTAIPTIHLSAGTLWVGGDEIRTACIRLKVERAGDSQAHRVLESLGAVDLGCLDDVAVVCLGASGASVDDHYYNGGV